MKRLNKMYAIITHMISTLIYIFLSILILQEIKKAYSKAITVSTGVFIFLGNIYFIIRSIKRYVGFQVPELFAFSGGYAFYFLLNLIIIFIPLKIIFYCNNKFLKGKKNILHTIESKMKIIIAGIFIIISYMIIIGTINTYSLKTTHYAIEIPKKKSILKSLKIALISDLHLGYSRNNKQVNKVFAMVKANNPDIILFVGDIFDFYSKNIPVEILNQLKNLKAPLGKHAVWGNHEIYQNPKKIKKLYAAIGVKEVGIINDKLTIWDKRFNLAGRYSIHYDRLGRNRKKLVEIIKHRTKNLPTFVIEHSPHHLPVVYNNNIDLHLSGHTHGGQFFPFQWMVALRYDFVKGLKKIKNTNFIISEGIGFSGIPIRLMSTQEVVIIHITFR